MVMRRHSTRTKISQIGWKGGKMEVKMDTFHPAATEVLLTAKEVVNLAKILEGVRVPIMLRYMDMDYEAPAVEYQLDKYTNRVVRL